MSLRLQKHLLDYQYADAETAKAAAEWEERRRREEEERKRREEEERRRQEEERRRQEERREEEQRQTQRQAERQEERRQQPQSIEEESETIRRRLEEQRRRQEEQRRLEEERKRREEEERRRREEEERRRREEEERRRRLEEQRNREEEERRRQEEEQRRRGEEERREEELLRLQPQSLEEEAGLMRRRLEERRLTQHRRSEQPQVAPGAPEGGKDRRDVGFDDVVEMLQKEKDPRKVVERLKEMGYEVEEVSEPTGVGYTYRYGWIVKVGDRYVAVSSGHRVGRGDVGDYAAVEFSDRGVARNFLVGRYWGTSWGEPEFAHRADEMAAYEKELDRWMREELGKLGYRAERVEWPEHAPARGFTYVIYDKEGRRVGEVQVSKLGFKYGLIGGFPPAVRATGDPRRAALYLVYRHMYGDENIAWRLATGDERAKELLQSKLQHEQELKAREEWFRELTERGLKPVAYSRIDGRAVVSEGDLFLDERTGVTYRVALERQDGKIAMKLVPATERDERLLALKSLEDKGFKVVDDRTVERGGMRYTVHVEEREGKKVLKLEPYPEDARKAAEREVWWELWRQGFVRRGEYAVKDGVKYKVDVEEQDGRYVVKLTPVGPASPEEEPRRYRRGDMRGSLEGMKHVQFIVEKLGLERTLKPEELSEKLRFGPQGRPRKTPYIPVLDEAFYGAVGVPLSQALFQPAGRELYQRYAAATLPGPRMQGLTLPERQQHERVAEIQRLYAERFADVWTPLTLRAPTEKDLSWRTAAATAAEAFTFWIPVAKGAAAFAAARGLKIPGLTVEKTAAAGRAVRLPKVPGDYFEVHFVEPRRAVETVRGVFVGEGVGEGAAARGRPGHWEFVFARSAGRPEPGWAFEFTTVTYRDVAEWLKRLPSVGLRAEVRPKAVRFAEVRGFARDFEPPRFEPLRLEPPKLEPPRGREVKVEWRVGEEATAPKAPEPKPPARDQPAFKPELEPPRRGAAAKQEPRAVAKAAQVEEELVRPIRAELPATIPVKTLRAEGRETESLETPLAVGEVPTATPVEKPAERQPAVERQAEAALRVEPLRELELTYPGAQIRTLEVPPFEAPRFETAAVVALETSRELETKYGVWTAETPSARVAEAPRRVWRTAPDGFTTPPPPPPPPPPARVRGGYGGGGSGPYMEYRSLRPLRRGWRVYEILRI